MIKKLLFILILIVSGKTFSQTVSITSNPGTSGNVVVGGSTYHASECIFLDSEIGATNFITAGTAINSMAFSLASTTTATLPLTVTNYTIYMQNVPAATTTLATGTYSLTGYTLVYSGSITFSAVGWNAVTLTTPFTRTAGSNLQILVIRNNGAAVAGTVFDCSTGNTTAGGTALTTRRYNNTTAPAENSTSLASSNFRFSIQLKKAFNNDLELTRIETLGKLPRPNGFPHAVKAVVTNAGLNTLAAGTVVSLSISGANTFTNTQTTSALAPGASQTITFASISSMNVGNNVVTVSIPNDDNTSNNSSTFNQSVSNNGFGYPNSDAAVTNGSIGFGAGSGLLLNKHNLPVTTGITGVKVYIGSKSNPVFGVICDAAGTILAQSANYTPTVTDSLTYVSFNFPSTVSIAANTDFYIGLGQPVGTYAFYPVGTQSESPARANTYASAVLAGGTTTFYTTLNRFMIEAIFTGVAPVTLSSFSGIKQTSSNLLSWTTSTEQNNAGFNLERSADGNNYSTLGFVASKATNGNSNTTLNYEFSDAKPFTSNNYYRLMQTDKDGKATYSQVVLLKGTKKAAIEISVVYPNPVQNTLNLVLSATNAEKATVVISDVNGKILSQQATQLATGDNNIKLNVSKLGAGNYTIQVIGENGNSETKKFVKH